jgi:hypothetical protein
LQEEKVPGMTQLGDVFAAALRGRPLRPGRLRRGLDSPPAILDRGFIVPDHLGGRLRGQDGPHPAARAGRRQVGRINREKRAIDCVIDENTTDHRYKWRGT